MDGVGREAMEQAQGWRQGAPTEANVINPNQSNDASLVITSKGMNIFIDGHLIAEVKQMSEAHDNRYECTAILPLQNRDNVVYGWQKKVDPNANDRELYAVFTAPVIDLYREHERLNIIIRGIADIDETESDKAPSPTTTFPFYDWIN